MDVILVLAAVIFTLLAIVVATSLLSSASPRAESASKLGPPGYQLNGHLPGDRRKEAAEDWHGIGASAHDHWDVVKSVQSEEAQARLHLEEQDPSLEPSSATPSLPSSGPGSQNTNLENEGAAESPDFTETLESNSNESLRYVPGKARSHHLETMMSKEELEEEQRVQREQLAAIFQLLKDNKETFGDVSEGEMEEQLRLYSI